MEEKFMIRDTIFTFESLIKEYESEITNCDNIEFKQLLVNSRGIAENFYFEIIKIAESKGYIDEKNKVNIDIINKLKKEYV